MRRRSHHEEVASVAGSGGDLIAFHILYVRRFETPGADPHQAKPDSRLIGLWRWEDGEVNYFHVGRAGGKLPVSALRVISVDHTLDGELRQSELLALPATIDNKTFVSIAECEPSQLKLLVENGWTDDSLSAYWILQYQITGDVLTLQFTNSETWKQAVETGKIKGTIEKNQHGATRIRCIDTTENLAKFVAEAGDELFESKAEMRLKRVE